MIGKNIQENNDVLKPSGAVQVVLTDNKKLSLVQRKSWNVLIVNASGSLKESETHTIALKTVLTLVGNNDIANLKRDLLKLMSTAVQFNYLKSRDKSVWEASTILADARIDDNYLEYSFGPLMRQKLNNPELYARINLAIQKKIDSKFSLILYELAKDHYMIASGRGYTPFIEINDLKKILECHSESYSRFAEFNRVIRKAMEEINSKTDITVNAVYKKRGKAVVAIQFQIKAKTDKSAFLEGVVGAEQKEFSMEGNSVYNILVNQFGINPRQAAELVRDYKESEIREGIAYTIQQQAKGNIKTNLSGFLYKAIKENYSDANPKSLPTLMPKIEEGMLIDVGGGKTETVFSGNVFKNSKNQIFATENDIRLNLASGNYKIVEPVAKDEPLPAAEDDHETVESDNGDMEMKSVIVEPDIQNLPDVEPGMKIDLGGVIFTVNSKKTLVNTHGNNIFTEQQLRKHLATGACRVITDET